MDEDVKRIVNQIFSVIDAKMIETMIEVVNKDMSESNKAKRMNDIAFILENSIK